METIHYSELDTPLVRLIIASTKNGLCHIAISDNPHKEFLQWYLPYSESFKLYYSKNQNKYVIDQINRYFKNDLTQFNCPIDLLGCSVFQKRVYSELSKIVYGTTCSYKELSKAIHSKKGYQAVGMALKKNPIPIVIPCHRVIYNNGEIGGFACGIDYKVQLLRHEKALLV